MDTYGIEEGKTETYNFNYLTILSMADDEWIEFLGKITFQFEEGDLETLSLELDKEIKECNFLLLSTLAKRTLLKEIYWML